MLEQTNKQTNTFKLISGQTTGAHALTSSCGACVGYMGLIPAFQIPFPSV